MSKSFPCVERQDYSVSNGLLQEFTVYGSAKYVVGCCRLQPKGLEEPQDTACASRQVQYYCS